MPAVFRRSFERKAVRKLPTTVSIRRINVEFSTKTEILQEQQAGAQLFVCTEASQLSNPTVLALLSSLEEGQNFADTKIPTGNGLQAVAVTKTANGTANCITGRIHCFNANPQDSQTDISLSRQ